MAQLEPCGTILLTTCWLCWPLLRTERALLVVVEGVVARRRLTPLASPTPQLLVVVEGAHQHVTPWGPRQPAQQAPSRK
jgi:hypothetical protein